MFGWFPKTSKLGGLKTCAHEPRKIVILGTMLKNSVEYNTDIIAHNEVSQNPDQQ